MSIYKYTLVHVCENIDGIHVARSYLAAIIPEDPIVVYAGIILHCNVYKINDSIIFQPMMTDIEQCIELEGSDFVPSGSVMQLSDFIEKVSNVEYKFCCGYNKSLKKQYLDQIYSAYKNSPSSKELSLAISYVDKINLEMSYEDIKSFLINTISNIDYLSPEELLLCAECIKQYGFNKSKYKESQGGIEDADNTRRRVSEID